MWRRWFIHWDIFRHVGRVYAVSFAGFLAGIFAGIFTVRQRVIHVNFGRFLGRLEIAAVSPLLQRPIFTSKEVLGARSGPYNCPTAGLALDRRRRYVFSVVKVG
jgi:hypothetical protein